MAINLFEANYVPTIFLRNAELLAVSELPEATKDILTPIFCLKPWFRSKLLSNSIKKIETAFGEGRSFFLDIDPFYKVEEEKTEAQKEFNKLIDPEGGYGNWTSFFEEYPNAYPCLQVEHADAESVRAQTAAFTKMEKVFLVRLTHGGGRNWSSIVDAVCETQHTNYGFVIDVEWGRDILSRAMWADGIVKQIVSQKGDSIPIILSGSSFPDSFANAEPTASASVDERVLFNNLVTNNNEARLIYGDWASSRSPTEGGGGGNEIPPRIDLSTQTSWEVFRYRRDDGGFQAAAKAAMKSSKYPKNLDIWATYAIAATAIDDPPGFEDPNKIKSLTRATAARINLHLYSQMHFDGYGPAPDTDDDYQE